MAELAEPADRSRQGRGWTLAECAELVEAIGVGRSLPEIAAAHGRSPGAIAARAVRLIPPAERVDRSGALAWLRARLATEPEYDWAGRLAEWERGRPQRRESARAARGARASAAVPPAALDEVLAEWTDRTGQRLAPTRAEEFLRRPVTAALAGEAAPTRRAAADRLWRRDRRLLLDDWLLECRHPGLGGRAPDRAAIQAGDPDAVLALRELLAAALSALPPRQRTVLAGRFGLDDGVPRSLAAVGGELGLTGERARQLQQRTVAGLATSDEPAARRLAELLRAGLGLSAAPRGGDRAAGAAPAGPGDRPAAGQEPAGSGGQTASRERPDGFGERMAGPGDRPAGAGERLTGEAAPAARLLVLAEALLPGVNSGQAVAQLARLAGASDAGARQLERAVAELVERRRAVARRRRRDAARAERARLRWGRLAAGIDWPGGPARGPAPDAEPAEPPVEPGDRSGRWLSHKLGREVRYSSQRVLDVVELLDAAPQVADFTEEPPVVTCAFDGVAHRYRPDLLVVTEDGGCVLVTVGAITDLALAVQVARHRALVARCAERGWGLLRTDGHRTLPDLRRHPVDPAVTSALATALAGGAALSWPDVCALRERVSFTHRDLAALVLRHGWEWRTGPYRLSAARQAPPADPA
ncbi:sigma factor-like helix-turn-helix DNA-binding protein [Streptomyces sp. DSM 44915]|uniref:Sigma factor-like helix-turn-helix DNA-binding protein n=1 Tax=Streptomyces chisholmiae TaxID=3075540 RepID=A0ABU2JUX8_9ACTN|nr:sigma factor-like helix-turn-helix DNA-binding protein [Streptomyces sp. DSM 44915]MDT0268788.1 sigma factor-like helix-turn-helix DNA-binding protein [Streptomyces sp. DSM 44915]